MCPIGIRNVTVSWFGKYALGLIPGYCPDSKRTKRWHVISIGLLSLHIRHVGPSTWSPTINFTLNMNTFTSPFLRFTDAVDFKFPYQSLSNIFFKLVLAWYILPTARNSHAFISLSAVPDFALHTLSPWLVTIFLLSKRAFRKHILTFFSRCLCYV